MTTVSIASDRRDRNADPIYIDLILWRGQAEAAAEHLVKGQSITFSGRFEPRPYTTRAGQDRVAFEAHDVALEYGSKPRRTEDESATTPPDPETVPAGTDDDSPF